MSNPQAGAPSARTRLRRHPERARHAAHERAAILDEALVAHVGFVVDGQPFVIPTLHARQGDTLYLHGSAASRMAKHLAEGLPVCVTVSLIDGLVLARSAYHHSINYRSVVVLGRARAVLDPEEKRAALRALVEQVAPGRAAEVRAPNEQELRATLVLALPLDETSVKVRSGPPVDAEEDYALPIWAGVVPLALQAGTPQPDPRLAPDMAMPAHVAGYRRPASPDA
jgi:hypothetical protein